MSNVIKFLNGKFIRLNMQENTNDNRQIEEGIIPSEDFFTLINKSERIMAAESIGIMHNSSSTDVPLDCYFTRYQNLLPQKR